MGGVNNWKSKYPQMGQLSYVIKYIYQSIKDTVQIPMICSHLLVKMQFGIKIMQGNNKYIEYHR